MIPKFDYGNLYKFKASLGLGLIVLGFIAPWIIFNSDFGAFLISSEITSLSENAQDIINDRVRWLKYLQGIWRVISFFLFLFGGLYLRKSLSDWEDRENVNSEIKKKESEKLSKEIESLTPGQKKDLIVEEIKEDEGVGLHPDKLEGKDAKQGVSDKKNEKIPEHPKRKFDINEIRATYQAIEDRIYKKISRIFTEGSGYSLQKDISIQRKGLSINFDIYGVPLRQKLPELYFEVKYIRNIRHMLPNIRRYSERLLSSIVRIPRSKYIKPVFIQIIVYDNEEISSKKDYDELYENVKMMYEIFSETDFFIRIYLIAKDSIEEASDRIIFEAIETDTATLTSFQ